jgi:Skp family chaperone for outer membrane proteins
MSLRKAAWMLGHSEANAVRAALSHPSVVVGRSPDRPGLGGAVVNCDQLADMLLATRAIPVGFDRRPWILRERAQAKVAAVRAKIDRKMKARHQASNAWEAEERAAASDARRVAAEEKRAKKERERDLRQMHRDFERKQRLLERQIAAERERERKKLDRDRLRTLESLARKRDADPAPAPRPQPTKAERRAAIERRTAELDRLAVRLNGLGVGAAGRQTPDKPTRPREAQGLTVVQTSRQIRLPRTGIGWLIRTGRLHLRNGEGRERLDGREVARFARQFVSVVEIERTWEAGRTVVDCLRLAKVPPVFPVKKVGVEVFERDYVRKIAAAL